MNPACASTGTSPTFKIFAPKQKIFSSNHSRTTAPCSHPLCPGRQAENLFALRRWVMPPTKRSSPEERTTPTGVSAHPQGRAARSHSLPTKLIFSFRLIRISSQSDLGFNFSRLHLKHQKTFFFTPKVLPLRLTQCGFAPWQEGADN